MEKKKVNFKKLRQGAKTPVYGSSFAAGADLHACIEEEIVIESKKTEFIPTGIAMEIPEGLVGLIYARSGLACKSGIAPANKVGVIDSDYRGEVLVALYNHSNQSFTIKPGDRIAQMVLAPYIYGEYNEVEELDETQRGQGGFGSTGK